MKKLEKELDDKDGETDKLMRGVEQKYNSVKVSLTSPVSACYNLNVRTKFVDHL